MTRAAFIAGVALLLYPSVTRAQTAVQPPDGYPAVGGPSTVTVLSTGAEPRRTLRYTVPADYRAHMVMDMTMSMAASMGGQSLMGMQMPTMRAGADLLVTSVSPAGDLTYGMSFTGVTVPDAAHQDPNLVTAFEALSSDFKTITATATITNRGVPMGMTVDSSQVGNPQLRQILDSVKNSLGNLSMPFPDEAVGVGARWAVRQSLTVTGMTVFQSIECELTALDATSATLVTKMTQTAPTQPMVTPDMPAGATATIESMAGSGGGTMKIAFGSIIPVSDASVKTTADMSISLAGTNQRMTMETTMRAQVSPGTP